MSDELSQTAMSLIRTILSQHKHDSLTVGDLQHVDFSDTRSKILQNNNCVAYCFTLHGLEGLFRKDQPATRIYGRAACDSVKMAFSCDGFFTSDELPRYGISEREITYLYQTMKKEKGDGQLIVILAYERTIAVHIRNYLVLRFQAELDSNSVSVGDTR